MAAHLVIDAVHGVAYGYGFGDALRAYMIVAGESAEFGFPEVTHGLIAGATYGAQWLPRFVGLPKAIELIGGRSNLRERGRMPPPGQLGRAHDTADGAPAVLAETLSSDAPLAVRAAKRVCTQCAYGDLSTILEYCTEVTTLLFETADASEGIRAFVDGGEPTFEAR